MKVSSTSPRQDAVQKEKERLFADRWASLPAALKTPTQMAGQTAVACGATHHVMERCNFSCTCCYLGAEANRTKALPFAEVARQLDDLRSHLGQGGKVQITAGEVTLLPLRDLGRIVRYALSIGLDPMVMSHGQRFLDEPEYLAALVKDYGLRKISIHLDTTQRGRAGTTPAMSETDLHPFRDRFADLIRRTRRETGRPLEAASTVTVTAGNLDEMSEVTRWFLCNADAFRLLSFLPVADVGRTRESETVGPVNRERLWAEVEHACGRPINQAPIHFGHPSCNVTVPLILARVGSDVVIFEGIRSGNRDDEQMFSRAMKKIGPRIDWTAPWLRNFRILLGIVLRDPGFAAQVMGYGLRRFGEEIGKIARLLQLVIRSRRLPQIRPFLIVIHEFMNAATLETPEGKERLEACVFKLPVDGRMVSMCEMNATGLRARLDRESIPATGSKASRSNAGLPECA